MHINIGSFIKRIKGEKHKQKQRRKEKHNFIIHLLQSSTTSCTNPTSFKSHYIQHYSPTPTITSKPNTTTTTRNNNETRTPEISQKLH
jgi:hypothetical protein